MCISPIRIRHPTRPGTFLDVPCGKCLECVKKRSNDLTFRLIEEMKSSIAAYFVTLTYDDDNLPIMCINDETNEPLLKQRRKDYDWNGILWQCRPDLTLPKTISDVFCFFKPDCQKFIRSVRDELRYYCKKHKLPVPKFKYFLSSEYGSKSLRPHYHALIFTDISNINLITNLIQKHWNYGFVSVSAANERRCYYAAKYALKSCFDNVPISGFERPFILVSKGLGLSFLSDAMVNFMRGENGKVNLQVHQEGKLKIIPRYYRDKVFTTFVDKLNLKQYFDDLLSSSDTLSNSPENCNPFRYRDDNYKHKVEKVKDKLKREKL